MNEEFAKLADLKPGQPIELDEGFTCHSMGRAYVRQDHTGRKYFLCSEGNHYLDGQCDDGIHCIGVRHVK